MSPLALGCIAVGAPLVAALQLMLSGTLRRSPTAPLLSAIGALLSLTASLLVLAERVAVPHAPPFVATVPWLHEGGHAIASVGLYLDGTSAVMLAIVSLVATCVQLYSLEYLGDESEADQGRYFAWQSLFLFSMQALVVAPDLLQLFMAWELVGLCSYLLIGFYWKKPAAGQAALKAFWMTKLADVGFLMALIVQYAVTGSFAWTHEVALALASAGALSWVVGLYFVGVMGKSGQFPLHVWLPDAMEGPTPVSALLHAATMVAAGVYLVVRAYPLFEAATAVLPVMSVIGGFTALFGACVALTQRDIKKVLAYSTVSQLGYMVAALGAGSVYAGYFHLGTHAFFKALLFLAAGSAIHAVHSNDIFDMGGLSKKMPWTAGLFVAAAAALAGLPLLSGFYSKDAILEALLHAAGGNPIYWLPLVACVATVFLTALYMARVTLIAFFGPLKHDGLHESGPVMVVPMLLLGLGAVFAGFFGGTLATTIGAHDVHFSALHLAPIGIVGTVLGLCGIAVAVYVPEAPALAPAARWIRRGYVDRAWAWGFRSGLLVLAGGVAWFDRYVVDGLVNVVGAGSLRFGERVRDLQGGRVNDYLLAVVLGALAIAVWSQTGGV